jgi:phosphoenolpyruvate---glycerone phosphotransferase subunit DhaL
VVGCFWNTNLKTEIKLVTLTREQTRDLLVKALRFLEEKASYLNELDRALGDGDHGTTIARGVKSAVHDLESAVPSNANEVFVIAGKAMMKSMGGASGVLYGVFFRGAQEIPGTLGLDARTLQEFLNSGLKNLQQKTKAQAGDKTMLDALLPALQALQEAETESLAENLQSAAAAAELGAQATVGMVPKFGRAKTLGERAMAGRDPGATSMAFLFQGLAEAAAELSNDRSC